MSWLSRTGAETAITEDRSSPMAMPSAFAWALSFALSSLILLPQLRYGLNLADEGYLWYGAWRTSLGEVPRVDFRSYDPLRVFWLSGFFRLFGAGPYSLRIGGAIIGWLGLALGLKALGPAVRDRFALVFTGLILVVWMVPRHKLFDHAVILAALFVASRLQASPDRRAALLCGFFVALAGLVRRNHGLYLLLAFVALSIVVGPRARSDLAGRLGAASAGAGLGLLPFLALTLLHPGLLSAHLQSFHVILDRGQTNHPLPIPWPWTVSLETGWTDATLEWTLGLSFMAYLAFFPWAIFVLRKQRGRDSPSRRLLLAGLIIGLPYSHHALVRSDAAHFCQAALPVVVGASVLASSRELGLGRWSRRTILSILLAATLTVPIRLHPRVAAKWFPERFTEIEVVDSDLVIPVASARLIEETRHLLDPQEKGPQIFVAPALPGLYRVLGQRCPIWDNYPLWPSDRETTAQALAELEAAEVEWVVLGPAPPGVQEFAESHPELWTFLMRDFHRVAWPEMNDGFELYRRTEPRP